MLGAALVDEALMDGVTHGHQQAAGFGVVAAHELARPGGDLTAVVIELSTDRALKVDQLVRIIVKRIGQGFVINTEIRRGQWGMLKSDGGIEAKLFCGPRDGNVRNTVSEDIVRPPNGTRCRFDFERRSQPVLAETDRSPVAIDRRMPYRKYRHKAAPIVPELICPT